MGNLSSAGVNLLESLEIAKSVSNNDVVTQALENVKKGVFSGDTLTKLFLKEPVFPPTFSQLISVGEQTGSLDEMFGSVAIYYEEEFDTAVGNLSSLISQKTTQSLLCRVLFTFFFYFLYIKPHIIKK